MELLRPGPLGTPGRARELREREDGDLTVRLGGSVPRSTADRPLTPPPGPAPAPHPVGLFRPHGRGRTEALRAAARMALPRVPRRPERTERV